MSYLSPKYLCPKCGHSMETVGLAVYPPIFWYECFSCGYKSKLLTTERSLYTKELWSDEENKDEIQSNR